MPHISFSSFTSFGDRNRLTGSLPASLFTGPVPITRMLVVPFLKIIILETCLKISFQVHSPSHRFKSISVPIGMVFHFWLVFRNAQYALGHLK